MMTFMGAAGAIKDYRQIEADKPFFILHKDPKKQDITVWKTVKHNDGYIGLLIYFHQEGFWCNPPTDSNMEYNATKAIEKYGIVYLPDNYIGGYEKADWRKKSEYRQAFAKDFFEGPTAPKESV